MTTALLAALLGGAIGAHAEQAIKSGDSIVFLGDSITEGKSPDGYMWLVAKGCEVNGIEQVKAVSAGVAGNTALQMLSRMEKDVLAQKPTWMTLSCGVNDIWQAKKGKETVEQYRNAVVSIVDKAQAAGIKVMILTATMISENPTNDTNVMAVPYNDALRAVAKEKNCLLADLNADMRALVGKADEITRKRGDMLTVDTVHPNSRGTRMMAEGILRAFGLTEPQIAKAKAAWLDMPCKVACGGKATLKQYIQVRKMADKQNTTMEDLLGKAMLRELDGVIKEATAKP